MKRLALWILSLAAGVALLTGTLAAVLWQQLPDLNALSDYQPKQALRILSADGELLGEFGTERRRFVPLSDIPKPLQEALLATEDVDFWEHPGLDFSGIVRAVWHNLWHERPHGASTITQQLARDVYLTKQQVLSRKLVEMLLALKMERELGKTKILEVYMNHIYLGHRAYGFASAAERYFGKDLNTLTLAEHAMLAGLPQNPVQVNPVVHWQRAVQRQHHVLNRMQTVGFISAAQAQSAKNQTLRLRAQPKWAGTADHALEMVRAELYSRWGEDVYARGLTVHTTLKVPEQMAAHAALHKALWALERRQPYRGAEEGLADLAEDGSLQLASFTDHDDLDDTRAGVIRAVSRDALEVQLRDGSRITLSGPALRPALPFIGAQVAVAQRLQKGSKVRLLEVSPGKWQLTQRPQVEGAVVSLEPQTGAIRALVGGFDFKRLQFNHAIQAYRQPGSAFKPFVYSALIELGADSETLVQDEPLQIGDWAPQNYDHQFDGTLTLRQALARSKNTPTVRLLQEIGADRGRAWAAQFGLELNRQPSNLTLALGTGAVTPLQMAGAYAAFAAGGERPEPQLITRVVDAQGQLIWEAPPAPKLRAVSERNAFMTAQLLQAVMVEGTGAKASVSLARQDLYGKTGTTNDAVDAWFVGFQADRAAAVWIGYPQPRSLGERETGGGLALPVWVETLRPALKDRPPSPLQPPDGVIDVQGSWRYEEFQGDASLRKIGSAPTATPASVPASSAINSGA
ncbi:penicillin-binding protein 1A [Inhella gelatinilytica]|uniref:Penicillin-binding protein 1A n=1 Tax=Inhella gelatinilytica TaxID=2795030 RepID=A0A931IXN5_9BURK|nr:PBP1A family penicillin-binding protein [Inhella gelatinilytica]MBH9553797.1 PBP1A family penicillin-binding protein [Inhella gelatinilytica]